MTAILDLMNYWRVVGRANWRCRMEDLWVRAAWLVPRRLAYWVGVRLLTHAACTLDDKEMDAISPSDMLQAWNQYPEERA